MKSLLIILAIWSSVTAMALPCVDDLTGKSQNILTQEQFKSYLALNFKYVTNLGSRYSNSSQIVVVSHNLINTPYAAAHFFVNDKDFRFEYMMNLVSHLYRAKGKYTGSYSDVHKYENHMWTALAKSKIQDGLAPNMISEEKKTTTRGTVESGVDLASRLMKVGLSIDEYYQDKSELERREQAINGSEVAKATETTSQSTTASTASSTATQRVVPRMVVRGNLNHHATRASMSQPTAQTTQGIPAGQTAATYVLEPKQVDVTLTHIDPQIESELKLNAATYRRFNATVKTAQELETVLAKFLSTLDKNSLKCIVDQTPPKLIGMCYRSFYLAAEDLFNFLGQTSYFKNVINFNSSVWATHLVWILNGSNQWTFDSNNNLNVSQKDISGLFKPVGVTF